MPELFEHPGTKPTPTWPMPEGYAWAVTWLEHDGWRVLAMREDEEVPLRLRADGTMEVLVDKRLRHFPAD